MAESHAAAFYPPNWVLYRVLDVPVAYRLSRWLHFIALAAATYAYARGLGLSPPGSALAAIGFSLCGFQAVHSVHEPFYSLMPYVPLCLLLGDRFVTTGKGIWLALLALSWGVQLTIGHFQIQMWTAVLVLVTGVWRVLGGGLPKARWLTLAAGLAWGAAIAWAQLRLTWELTRLTGFSRPPEFLSNYLFPPAHWAQWALPELYLGRPPITGDPYWAGLGTTPEEACAYVGISTLILSCVGAFALRRSSILVPWRWIVPLSFALATMPRWWPEGFRLLLMLPGLGWFRAPARYTLLTSLGLILLAGRGLDRSITRARFWTGLVVAIVIGAGSWAWSVAWVRGPLFQASLGSSTLSLRLGTAAMFWGLSLITVIAWYRGCIGSWAPLAVQTAELCALFYLGSASWGWSPCVPQASPVLQRLAREPGAGLVAGRLQNLPAQIELAPAFPALGITPPPPNYLLESSLSPPGQLNAVQRRWQRRFGVTHGVWSEGDDIQGTEVVAVLADPALERIFWAPARVRPGALWTVVRDPRALPAVWVALRAREVADWPSLYTALSLEDRSGEVWFIHGDHSPETEPTSARSLSNSPADAGIPKACNINMGVPARSANVRSWNGRTAVVDHDGTCYLILRRTFYDGWFYRVNDGAERPVFKVNGGLQGIPLTGTGPSDVTLIYRPTGLRTAAGISLGSMAAALCVVLVGLVKKLR